jgi:hypothetical protein
MKENARFFTSSFFNHKIIRFCLWVGFLGVFAHGCAAADDDKGADENAMILRSGRKIPKTSPVNSSLQLQTYPSQVADDEGRVRKRRRLEGKEEENHFVEMSLIIPPVAQGHEEIYRRFLNGKLIYKPDPESDEGKVELRIADLEDPLNGTFDLSRCGDAGKDLSITTGYRRGKKPENSSKVEIWFAPRFLVKGELNTTSKHFKRIFHKWKETAEVGMFWTWGGRAVDDPDMDYLVSENIDNLSKINLYENWKKSAGVGRLLWVHRAILIASFHVSFVS